MNSDAASIVGSRLNEPHVVAFLDRFAAETERYDETCEDGQFHLIAHQHGWEIYVRGEFIVSLWLHSGTERDFRPFIGDLPLNISFDDSRDSVRAKFGEPIHASDIDREHYRPHDVFRLGEFRTTIYYMPGFMQSTYVLLNRS